MEMDAIIEAALFLSPKPLGLNKLAELVGTGAILEVKQSIERLQNKYSEDSGIEIVDLGNYKYKMRVKPQYADKVDKFAVTTDLSSAELKTLALIAYKQPIKQSEVVASRGPDAYKHIKVLIDQNFVVAKKERNTLVLSTGPGFRRYFGTDAVVLKRKVLSQE